MILIVDDNIDIAGATRALIKCEGFEAGCVYGGADALIWLSTRDARLIILDDNMPGMTGFELLAELRRDPRLAAVPVLFHSAEQRLERHAQAMALGAKGWFVKGPESWSKMTTRVRELLT